MALQRGSAIDDRPGGFRLPPRSLTHGDSHGRAPRLSDISRALAEDLEGRVQRRTAELEAERNRAVETAEALDISVATVKRQWAYARAWLFRKIRAGTDI